MTHGRLREAWNHTAAVLAMIANVNRDPKKHRVFRPDDFNPYAGGGRWKQGTAITTDNIRILKKAFIDNRRA